MIRRAHFVLALLIALLCAACNLNAPPPTPVPTPDVPRAYFNNLENGAIVTEGTDVQLDIVAQDETAGVAKIELYVDGEFYNEGVVAGEPVPIFRVTMNWLAAGAGRHTLGLLAYRADGTASDDTLIAVEVVAGE
jgi:hypothetical protein